MALRTWLRVGLKGLLAVSLALLLLTSALAGLRSPTATAEVGAALADDSDVRAIVVELATDSALAALADGPVPLGPLLPLLRPAVANALTRTLASEAGRTVLATALADLVQQATFGPPLVLDLRGALAAGLERAPSPLDDLARGLLSDPTVGLVVVVADGVGPAATPDAASVLALREARSAGEVAGLPPRSALTLLSGVSMALTAGLALSGRGRRERSAQPAGVLVAVALPVALLLTFGQGAIAAAIVRFGGPQVVGATDGALAAAASDILEGLLPLLTVQFSVLLTPTRFLASAVCVVALSWAAVDLGLSRRRRRAE